MEILKNIFSKLTPWTIDPLQSLSSENVVPNTSSTQNFTEIQTLSPLNQLNSYTPCVDYPTDLENELCLPWTENPFQSIFLGLLLYKIGVDELYKLCMYYFY